jgi:hypothetical protein
MQSQINTMIVDDGSFSGWEFVASRNGHDIDAMDDLYTIELWPPDANQPAHSFATYRHAYGWTVINAALAGDDEQMQAALDWWTEHHTSAQYEIHRILVAIDDTTWATRDETAHRLGLGTDDLEPGAPYGDALATAERHGLVTWRNQRATPYLALTPTGYDLIHPDDQSTADADQRNLAGALTSDQPETVPTPPSAGKAFPTINHVTAQAPAGLGVAPPAPLSARSVHSTRRA